ncbi:phage portal protein [Bacillus sp. NPDC077027]|uniref:phage portal protein n=1 Tax=Bacillus sp. NPDC077027 TaxID=3390548 RepID=UPI003CFC7969
MNREVGAIMHYVYTQFPVKMYNRELPERFQVPSIYIPPVSAMSGPDTVSTFMKTYSLHVKLFHHDSEKAFDTAETIVDALNADRNMIQMVSEKGQWLNDYIRIKRVETRSGDQGVATIVLTWDSTYWYNRDKHLSLEDVYFSDGVIKNEQN